jgi:dihydropteroate synthase type 2
MVASRAMHPRVVGIVNLTRDSFSDGGRLAEPSAAVAHALSLVADGAALIDLGPAASNPDAVPVSAAEEIRRLEPALDGVLARGVTVSVDSCQVETQRYAVARGVAYLNDIRGFPDPSLYEELARTRCRLVVMHAVQRGPAATRELVDPHGVVDRVTSFFAERVAALESAGVSRDRIILDPGMGYFLGGVAEASLAVLRALGELKARFGRPLWISVSRKSFLGTLTGRAVSERGPATLAAELWAVGRGVDYIRTHDVRALCDAVAVVRALQGRD